MDAVTLGLAQAYSRKASKYGTKRAGYVVSTPAGFTGTVSEGNLRIPLRLPVTTTRWRLHIRNWDPNTGTVQTGAINFTGAWVGAAKFDATGSAVGLTFANFISTPTQALSSFSTPSDGSEYVSNWVTTSGAQITADLPMVLSLGFTASGVTHSTGIGPAVFLGSGAGTSANAGLATAGTSGTLKTGYWDFWVEYEFVGSNPVVFVIGDSISTGQTTNSGRLGSTQGTLPWGAWPHVYQARTGACVINGGRAGVSAAACVSPTNGLYTRFGFGTNISPDAAIVALGSNDFAGNQAQSTVSGYMVTICDLLRTAGMSKVHLGTVIPRSLGTSGTVTTTAASGVTSLTTSVAFANNDSVTVGWDTVNEETLVVSGVSTGTGPYTTTFTTSTTKAHTAGEELFNNIEANRRKFNRWARTTPYLFAGCIDFDRHLSDPNSPSKLLVAYADSDMTHLVPQGYTRMADVVPAKLAGY